MDEEKYKDLIIELYKDNQGFLNKAILSISSAALPIILSKLSENDLSLCATAALFISLILFASAIIIQVRALKFAKDGCDQSYSSEQEKQENGERLFTKARKMDQLRDHCFIFAIICLTLTPPLNLIKAKESMTKKTPDKELINSFTPPKSVTKEQKSFTPPKTAKPAETDNKPSKDK